MCDMYSSKNEYLNERSLEFRFYKTLYLRRLTLISNDSMNSEECQRENNTGEGHKK